MKKIRDMKKHTLMGILVLGALFAMPGILFAHRPHFIDSFMLESCNGFSSTGSNPFFILEPGYQLIL